MIKPIQNSYIQRMKAFGYEFKFHVDNMQAVLWYTHCKELTEFRKGRTLIEYFKQEKVTPKDYCEKIRDLLQDLCIQKSNNTFEAEYIPPLDGTVIDCGANQGYKSLIYAFQVGRNGKVIAIEGDEGNHLQIEKNAALNKIENISAVRAVVGAESRKRVSFSGERVAKRTGDRIKMVKIDDFYDDEPCFLKIDVEGYEHEVLKGAVRVLHTYHPLLEIELHTEEFLARYGSSRKKVVEFLREHNYDIVFSRGKEFPYEKLGNYDDGQVWLFCRYNEDSPGNRSHSPSEPLHTKSTLFKIPFVSGSTKSGTTHEKMYHLHIPKTGGTTLNSVVSQWFPDERIFSSDYWINIRSNMEDQGTWEGYDSFPFDQLFREFDLIFEHKNMLKYLPESFLKVCILRDPLERVYSQHADWARLTDQNIAHNPPKIREEKLKARRLSLAEMVSQASHNSTVRHFQNGMCKSFLGESVKVPILNDRKIYTDNRLFLEAKERLDEFDHVCFTETLNSDLTKLASSFGRKISKRRMPHLNKNPTSQKGGFDSLSMEDKEIIRSHHRADCRLYEYALAKFSEKSV